MVRDRETRFSVVHYGNVLGSRRSHSYSSTRLIRISRSVVSGNSLLSLEAEGAPALASACTSPEKLRSHSGNVADLGVSKHRSLGLLSVGVRS